jgi:hypothetical protein
MILDWSLIVVRTDGGTILPLESLKRFQLELDQFLWTQRTGITMSAVIDWSDFFSFMTQKGIAFRDKSGAYSPKAILTAAEADLTNYIETQHRAAILVKKVQIALDSVFDEMGTTSVDRNTAITAALMHLKTPLKQLEAERSAILQWLKDNSHIYVSYGRPTVYLGRLIKDGKPTEFVMPAGSGGGDKSSSEEDGIIGSRRLTAAIRDAGIGDRSHFAQLCAWWDAHYRPGSSIDASRIAPFFTERASAEQLDTGELDQLSPPPPHVAPAPSAPGSSGDVNTWGKAADASKAAHGSSPTKKR